MIIVIVMIGAYSFRNSSFEVAMVVIFGGLGYLARKNGFPFAPCVLAMILGRKLEQSVHQALRISAGDFGIFIEKPISATLLAVAVLIMLIPVFKWARKRHLS